MTVRIIIGDALTELRQLPAESVHCCVTSPPYWGLRNYGVEGQIGLEPDFRTYIAAMVSVFREVRRVLRSDGTLWLNLGDSYCSRPSGIIGKESRLEGAFTSHDSYRDALAARAKRQPALKHKDLMMMPARVAIALQDDGWWVRRDIIWAKPNPMPESCADRCTSSHEYLYHLSKSANYYYNAAAIRETAVAADLGEMDGGSQRLPDGSNANGGRNYRPQKEYPGEQGGARHPGTTRIGKNETSPDRRRAGFNERWDAKEARIGAKGNAKTFRGGSYVGGDPGPRVEHGNQPNETFSRNKRSVWTVATAPFGEAHFATFPPALIEPCILAGCPKDGMVLDPFLGAGTTALVADRLGRNAIGIELFAEVA